MPNIFFGFFAFCIKGTIFLKKSVRIQQRVKRHTKWNPCAPHKILRICTKKNPGFFQISVPYDEKSVKIAHFCTKILAFRETICYSDKVGHPPNRQNLTQKQKNHRKRSDFQRKRRKRKCVPAFTLHNHAAGRKERGKAFTRQRGPPNIDS